MAAKRSDIEKQIAALQAQLDDADTDDEVWIKEGDHEFKVTGKRATALLGKYAKLWEIEVADDTDADDEDEDDTDDIEDDKQPKREGYFKGKAK